MLLRLIRLVVHRDPVVVDVNVRVHGYVLVCLKRLDSSPNFVWALMMIVFAAGNLLVLLRLIRLGPGVASFCY